MDKEFETLTEEELEAIQGTRNDEHLTKLATGESAEVVRHDLTSEYNNVSIATDIFDSVSEKARAILQEGIASVLNTPYQIDYVKTEVCRFEALLASSVSPVSATTLDISPLQGHAILLIDSSIIFHSSDRFFGGAGVSTIGFTPNKKLEGSEEAIVDIVVNLVKSALKTAWGPIFDSSFEKELSTNNLQEIQCFTPEELVVLSDFQVTIGELSGVIQIAYPLTAVRPPTHAQAKRLDSKVKENAFESNDWTQELYEAHLEIGIEVNAKLGEFTTTLGKLANLQVGDEFPLLLSDSIEVSAGNTPLFLATAGTVGELFAIKIESMKKI